jgi:hypothetical protein
MAQMPPERSAGGRCAKNENEARFGGQRFDRPGRIEERLPNGHMQGKEASDRCERLTWHPANVIEEAPDQVEVNWRI